MQINKDDLKWEYLCAKTVGGQHANKSATNVRLTHLPSKIVVTVNGRSQSRNKIRALTLLKYKLEQLQEEQNTKDKQKYRKEMQEKGIIRTYNYLRSEVKDHRTGKKANLKRVMEGELDLIKEKYPNMRFDI